MTTTVDITTLVKTYLTKNKTKSEIITLLVREQSMDLQAAADAYLAGAKDAGLVLTNEEKDAVTARVVIAHVTDNTVDRKKAEEQLVSEGHLTKAAASSRVKAYCEKNKIVFPKTDRVKRDMAAVKAAVKAWHGQGVDKAGIIAGLKEHYAYTDNSAVEAYRKLGLELGFIEKRGAIGRENLIKWFQAIQPGTEKKAIIETMVKPKNGGGMGLTKSTAEGYYGMWIFAKAYHQSLVNPIAPDTTQ